MGGDGERRLKSTAEHMEGVIQHREQWRDEYGDAGGRRANGASKSLLCTRKRANPWILLFVCEERLRPPGHNYSQCCRFVRCPSCGLDYNDRPKASRNRHGSAVFTPSGAARSSTLLPFQCKTLILCETNVATEEKKLILQQMF